MLLRLTLFLCSATLSLSQTLATSPNFPSCPRDNGKLGVGYFSGIAYTLTCGYDLSTRAPTAVSSRYYPFENPGYCLGK
jgi:hypothetical protein